MSSSQIAIMITIGVYLIGMIIVGIRFTKKNNSSSDFYLGGRKLGPFVTAMSAEASDMSSWLLMGLPGVAYLTGICDAGWTAAGLAVGTYFNWLIVAKRLRNYTYVCKNSITIPEFFSNRYRDTSKLLLAISALVILIFFVPYTASGFAACGKLFASIFGVDYFYAMLISAAVIVLYTALGGFLAASTTDFIQSIIMSFALVIVLLFGVYAAGGIDNVMENAKALPGYLSMLTTYDAASSSAQNYGFIKILSTFAWGLGYFGMPHILLRFMAIEDENKLKLSRRVATVWVVISLFIATIIGVIGLGIVQAGAMAPLADSETIIIEIANLLSKYGIIFAVGAGLILAGILASTMSTADSQLLAAASSISEDFVSGALNFKLSKKATMVAARVTVIVISIIAVIIASDPESKVFDIVSFSWAGFGAAFGPVVLFALFWKRSNRYGALAGMIGGAIMVFLWKYGVRPLGGAWDVYELLPAFIVASALIVVVSLLTEAPSKEIIDEFEKVNELK